MEELLDHLEDNENVKKIWNLFNDSNIRRDLYSKPMIPVKIKATVLSNPFANIKEAQKAYKPEKIAAQKEKSKTAGSKPQIRLRLRIPQLGEDPFVQEGLRAKL